MAALRKDPEFAERALQRAKERRVPYAPRPEEWDQQAELMAQVVDRLGLLTSLVADLPIAGKKRRNKPPKPLARPVTAMEAARAKASEQYLAEIEDDVEAAQARWRELNKGKEAAPGG